MLKQLLKTDAHWDTNMKTVDYANEYLFKPLGIKPHINYYVETAEEHKAFTIGKQEEKL